MQPSLFEAPADLNRQLLASRLRSLAEQEIYIGGSSWKYEGWLGQIYTTSRYSTRGRFSRKRFEEECLAEYAETFPIVCGDFSFYQFPTEQFWQKLFAGAGPELAFAFKVPEEITCRSFPMHPRYGARAGMRNPAFLDAGMFEALFLQALEPYRHRVSVLIFEFGAFSRANYPEPEGFCADLDAFLSALPRGWRYSVEIRNADFLKPAYFDTLRRHEVAHVFNAWNRMPPLQEQMEIPEAYTAGFGVARGLLRSGRSYEQAVALFSPYDRVQQPYPEARKAIRNLVERSRQRREPLYLFINNRLEGNTPGTIQGILDASDSEEGNV